MDKVGIQNIGNTCFMNSVLQALLHTPILWKHFWKSFPIYSDKRGGVLAKELHDVFTNALMAKPHAMRFRGKILSIRPDAFVNAFETSVRGHRNIQYRRGIQLCSAEVSRYIFENIHAYLSNKFTMEITPGSGDSAIITRQMHSLEAFIKAYTTPKVDATVEATSEATVEKGFSEIANKFHGQTQIITSCTNCKKISSENYESWEMLPLAIPGSDTHGATAPSLLDCVADQFNDELVDDYYCDTCKLRDKVYEACVKAHAPRNGKCCRDCYKLATGNKRNRISRFPEYISIELKRYTRDLFRETTAKVSGGIIWDLDNLNLEPYSAFGGNPFGTPPPRYRTYAVIEHHGRSPDSGHYYARIRRGDKWFEFNDDIPAEEIPKECVITNNSYIIYATSDPTYDAFFTTELPAYKAALSASIEATGAAGAAAPF